MTIGAAAERLWLDPSTVTPLVKRMEAAGLVTRARSEADERQVFVYLEDGGQSIAVQCDCLGEALVERSGITLDHLLRINRKLQRLHDPVS